MATIQIDGGRTVNYSVSGDGPPLLLIRGLGGAGADWGETVDRLSPHFQVITFDHRDAGLNEPETTGYAIADMADDAAGLLRALGIERAHVIGHSMGGFIAQHLVLNHPDVVDHLVLVGTSPAAGAALGQPLAPPTAADWIDDPAERSRARAPLTHGPGYFDNGNHAEELEEIARISKTNRMTHEGYSRQIAAISDTHDVRERLGEVAAPTLVAHGDADPLVSLRGGQILADGIPGAIFKVYPGVGHYPYREAANDFYKDLAEFLG
jgi:pimeloyl-ACP methyl ester carboxylesterase